MKLKHDSYTPLHWGFCLKTVFTRCVNPCWLTSLQRNLMTYTLELMILTVFMDLQSYRAFLNLLSCSIYVVQIFEEWNSCFLVVFTNPIPFFPWQPDPKTQGSYPPTSTKTRCLDLLISLGTEVTEEMEMALNIADRLGDAGKGW